MKKIIAGFILVFSISLTAQELVKTTQFKIPKKSESFQIVEEDTKYVTFFFSNKKTIKSIRFNSNFEIIDSLSVAKNDKELEDIIGYSITDNVYHTFWSTSKGEEFISQSFDFKEKKVSSKKHILSLGKEKIIKKITIKNVFYIVTLSENSSILNFHFFNGNQFDKKSVNLKEKIFYDFKDTKTTLWEVFFENNPLDIPMPFETISNDSPASLTFTSRKKKCYNYGDDFIITLDNNKKVTQYIKISLIDFSSKTIIFKQPKIIENSNYANNTNSFLLQNGIVQMKINSDNMVLSFKNLENIEVKSYTILKDKEIEFRNSEINQENKNVKNNRVLDKSTQLLRKIHSSNPSVSCYTKNDVIYLTIGSASVEEDNSAIMVGSMIGGLSGALIGAALTTNYSVNNLNSYANRKVIYINSLFDANFNHIAGDAKKLAFDKLRIFAEDNKNLKFKTIFKLDSNLYFAGIDKETKSYSFYKFTD